MNTFTCGAGLGLGSGDGKGWRRGRSAAEGGFSCQSIEPALFPSFSPPKIGMRTMTSDLVKLAMWYDATPSP